MLVLNNITYLKQRSFNPASHRSKNTDCKISFGNAQQRKDKFEKAVLVAENKESIIALGQLLSGMPGFYLNDAISCCADANGRINNDALEFLYFLCKGKKSFLDKLLHRDNPSLAYKRGGMYYVLSCLEASKDAQNNHCKTNLEFVKELLSDKNFPSFYQKVKPEFLIKAAKDSKGYISKEGTELINILNKSDLIYQLPVLMDNNGLVNNDYRAFVLKNADNRGKIDKEHLKTIYALRVSSEKDKLLKEISENVKLDPKVLNSLLILSNVDNDITLENFKTILSHADLYKVLLCSNTGLFVDNKKKIRHSNLEFCEKICPIAHWNKETMNNISDLGKDKDGVIKKDFTDSLERFLKKNPEFQSVFVLNFLNILKSAKNSDESIEFDAVRTFADYYETIRKKIYPYKFDDKSNPYNHTIPLLKNKDGDIDLKLVKSLEDLLNNGFIKEIPYMIKAAKNSSCDIDAKAFSLVKNLVQSSKPDEKIDMAKYLSHCKDKNGNFDDKKCKTLTSVQNLGIKSNIIKIATALQNPDGSSSIRGLALVKKLKNESNDIKLEEDLPKIIKLCRNAAGYIDDDCVDCAQHLQRLNSQIKLSVLLKCVKKVNGEISKERLKTLEAIIKNCKITEEDTLDELMNAAVDKKGKTDFDFLNILIKIQQSGYRMSQLSGFIPAMKAFAKYSSVNSFTQLNLQQKRDFMHKITRYKNEICDSRFQKILDISILPKNESEYCETVGKLSHYIGINVRPINEGLKNKFYETFKEMSSPTSEFMKLDFDNHIPKIELKYPLYNFQYDVWHEIEKLKYSVRTQACDFFGFELKQKGGHFIMNGYPKANNVNSRLNNIKDKDVHDAICKISKYVEKFTQNNTVSVAGNPKLSKQLTTITQVFPEFLTTIGKPQHSTQDYTLGVHILKVLQNVYKNPQYTSLPEDSKKQISLAALLHDISKSAGVIDLSHPQDSAFDVYYLLDKLNLKEKDKCKIYQLIKNHSWLAEYSKSLNKDISAKEIAFEFRQDDAFKLALMLTEADLKGVQRYGSFFKKHGVSLKSAEQQIKPLVFELQKTTINLPQAKIPKVHKLNTKSQYVKQIQKDGVKNTVVYLRKGIDLRKAGFDEDVKLEDLNFLVHALDEKNSSFMLQALGLIDSNALLSSSYVNYGKGNWRAFRKQGFVLDVASSNIHAGYWRDFGSGYKKGKSDLFNTYLFKNNQIRNYFSDSLKQELKLTDRQYINLIRRIEDMSITELDVAAPRVAKAYRKIFNSMETHKRAYGRNYNEILISRPKIQAIFCYDQNPENVPVWLRRYAQKNNLPILVFE